MSGCATPPNPPAPNPPAPTSTLDKVKATRAIALGYRESAIPFSSGKPDLQPVGYSVDLCTRIVADLQRQLPLPDLQIKWEPVTAESRIPALLNGTIDLECGSTTKGLKNY
jgi:glutamate/aspartate transport system substrate-binding protein